MNNLAYVILDGNLTADPNRREIGQDKSVTSFSLAINHEYANKDGGKHVSYIDIETWDKLGDNCSKYLHKGSRVTITGQLRQDRWKDDHGNNRSKIKVTAQTVRFDSKPNQKPEDQAA